MEADNNDVFSHRVQSRKQIICLKVTCTRQLFFTVRSLAPLTPQLLYKCGLHGDLHREIRVARASYIEQEREASIAEHRRGCVLDPYQDINGIVLRHV